MSENKWTAEQQLAIDTRDCNLLVAAAAGAGKTAVLVERIIKRITNEDRPVDIDRLLVVTFTNAAASEMRERIGNAISEALDKNPDSKRLQTQITLLNRASITTIHSFCLDIIRNNFHRLDLDPNFRIGDDTETVLLKQEAIEELFDECYENEDNEEFLKLVECYGGSRDDSALSDIVLSLYDFAKASPWPEKWLDEVTEKFNIDNDFNFGNSDWARVLLDSIRIELTGLESLMKKAVAMIKASEGLEAYLTNFELELMRIQDLINSCETSWESLYYSITELKFDRLKSVKNADFFAKEAVVKIRNGVKEKIGKIKEDILNKDSETLVNEIKTLYPLVKCLCGHVIEFDKKYMEKKKEKGIIDFNDIEHFALKILTEIDEEGNINPSEIALGYREKFDEILIDEYQDSNLVQEVLLETIAKRDIPNRFMVGDVKQSIYRFRQAKPELFLEKYNNYSTDGVGNSRKIMLFKNFRSRLEVIEGTNYIFKKIMSARIGELDYTDIERLNLGASFKENEDEKAVVGGPVEIHLIEKKVCDEIKENQAEEDEEDSAEEEPIDNIQLEARMIARRIKELMRESQGKKFKVFDKKQEDYRDLEFKDIVILLRATSNWAPVFLEELTNAGIPTFADTGVGYFETTEIKTIISLLQVIDNPMQDIPLLAVLKSPIFSFTPEEMISIRIEEQESTFYEALQKIAKGENELAERAREFLATLKRWQDKALHMSIDEFIWYIYKETGYYGYVGAMVGGVQRQANLRVLFERAKQYEQTSFKGLFNFINFINKLRVSSGDMGSAKILGENENVVRIMSIHKSKGLEFPVVICAGMGKQFNMQDLRNSILFHHNLGLGPDFVDYRRRIAYPSIVKEAIKKKIRLETLSEEMRILYVAFTRAKEKLIITGSVSDIDKTAVNWGQSIGSLNKIPEAEVLKAKTFLDWICPAIIKHSDCGILREKACIDESMVEINEISKWEIRLWYRDDILKIEKEEMIEEMNIIKELEKIDIDEYSSEFAEKINNRLGFQYPYMSASNLPAKLSVTEVKRILNAEALDEDSTSIFERELLKKPAFLEGKVALTAAERGTIMHLVMQKLDLLRVYSYQEIKDQILEMVENEILTELQAESVYIKRIEDFFKSDLGRRITTALKVQREIPFHIELKSTEIYKDLPIYCNEEMIALQGIIDCYFEEDDGLVLIDYKTDFVNEDNIEKITEKYRVQIQLYARALEKITGKRVKEKYIYLFYNGGIIRY